MTIRFFATTAILSFLLVGFYSLAATEAERRQLEQQLADLENQIAQHEATIIEYQKQGKNLQGEINSLNAKINKINLQIKSINLTLSRLDGEISDTKSQIKTAEEKMEINRRALFNSVRKLYENERQGLIMIILRNEKLSDFFGDMNNIVEVQNSLSVALNEITALRGELVDKKETLSIQRANAAALKAFQNSQQATLGSVKKEKATILDITKGQESKFQSLLKETRKTAAQIRSRLFELIGGGSLTFDKAYEFAKFAEQSTGIRAALILAVLDRESSFGENVGRCPYQEAMHPTRDLPIFLALLADLQAASKAPPEPVLVSCPISRHGAFGGAMGPAQFIPSTWNLYKNRISEITGNNPASPWNNGDAFMGTALYLKDAYDSKSCRDYGEANKNILPEKMLRERCAAAKYYAGGNWYRYRFFYGDPVVERASEFQQDIDILTNS